MVPTTANEIGFLILHLGGSGAIAASPLRELSKADGSVLPLHQVLLDTDKANDHLKEAGIATGIHYPIPLHMQKAYDYLNYRQGDFPVSEKVSSEIVSLPMYPHLRGDQQSRIVSEIVNFVSTEQQRSLQPKFA